MAAILAIWVAVSEREGEVAFVVQDADSNWWEMTNRNIDVCQAVFERGDVV